ncbi:MAG: gamma-glutamyl-phosphate reductase, partial [Porticoccaceae bacterium]|nr:gamma-glutamyl-phosphate reductase [Porticoccaceae bacterium]
MDITNYMNETGQRARTASRAIARASSAQKNSALLAMAEALDGARQQLLSANEKDLATGRNSGLDAALLDRLALDNDRIDGMIEGLRQVASLEDPVGEISDLRYRPSGIQLGKMRVPLG